MIRIKRGDTFAFFADIKNKEGLPLITSVANIRSQIRDASYQLITELTIAVNEVPGRYLFTAPSTDNWPTHVWGANKLLMDIELNISGTVNSSDTIEIEVIKDVTYNG